jgi:VIT1/CCC1 family predicted Fe2+/Mn2+ transporter
VARDASFRRQFVEMAGISLGVAALSFGVGFALRSLLGVEI